jgi:hypothetical protein
MLNIPLLYVVLRLFMFSGRRAIREWQEQVLDSSSKRYCVKCSLCLPSVRASSFSKESCPTPDSSARARRYFLETGFSFDVEAIATRFRKCASPWFAQEMKMRFGLTLKRVELLCLGWDDNVGFPNSVSYVAMTAGVIQPHAQLGLLYILLLSLT